MSHRTEAQSEPDPDGDPEMMDTATQPDQAEGSDDPGQTGGSN